MIDFSDSMIFAMALPNVIGLYLLMPVVKRELHKYQAKLASGELKKFKKGASIDPSRPVRAPS